MKYTDLEIYEAVALASLNPAKLINMDNSKGSIKIGKDADLIIFDEELKVSNLNLASSEVMSIRGKFLAEDSIKVFDYHIHSNRNIYSYLGLALIFIFLILSIINTNRNQANTTKRIDESKS